MKRYLSLSGFILLLSLSVAAHAAVVNYDIQRIGLVGDGYETAAGYSYSDAWDVNDQAQVIGGSERFSSNDDSLGQDAWLYDSGTTTQIGYTGTDYESTDGYRYSVALELNEQGQTLGYSDRISDSGDYLGQDAWLYDGGTLTQLGYTGAGYESDDGYRESYAYWLNEQGQVAGESIRTGDTGDYLGSDAWLYDGGTTTQIGYTGAGYESADGFGESWTNGLNEQGQVIGSSTRYSGSGDELGYDAWLYDAGALTQLGFTGTGYARSDGYRRSEASRINDQGQVAGNSLRYSATDDYLGADAWLYNGSTTTQLGFTGAGYERNDGWRYSYTTDINNQGQVAGSSNRYSGAQETGRDAWLYDGSVTRQLGFTGAGYEDTDGTRVSDAYQLNELSQVIGISVRFDAAGEYKGQDAWFYDADLDQTFSLSLYVDPTGYADSYASFLSDDGVALGASRVWDNGLGQYTEHAFYFTVDDGLIDLGLLVDDLTDDGWAYLYSAISMNGVGNIVGKGLLADGSSSAYLLTPTATVPVPAAVWLFTSGLGLLGWMGRRHSA